MTDWRDIAGDQNLRLSQKVLEQQGEINDLRAELAQARERLDDGAWTTIEAERDRYKAHSITLNSVAFAIAEALGDVPPGADHVEGNPVEQAQRLIAERDQLRNARDENRALLGGWERFAERIAKHIPEHYDGEGSMQGCIEDWARDADAVVSKAQDWRKNGRRTPGVCACRVQARQRATKPEEHAHACPAYVPREETALDAAVEKIYPSEDYL